MDLSPPPRRSPRESIVPMINVVFLLLIFFLMTATLEPSPPLDLTLPLADAPQGTAERKLYVTARGEIAYLDLRDEAALAALAASPALVALHADAGLPATDLARLLARLAALGLGQVELATLEGAP
jgi:biopolymer transport protein ExbD